MIQVSKDTLDLLVLDLVVFFGTIPMTFHHYGIAYYLYRDGVLPNTSVGKRRVWWSFRRLEKRGIISFDHVAPFYYDSNRRHRKMEYYKLNRI